MRLAVVGLVIFVACAAQPRKMESAPPAAGTAAPKGRVLDTVPERSAGLDEADPDLHHDANERRWGLGEARRRREAAEKADAGVDGPPAPGSKGSFIFTPNR